MEQLPKKKTIALRDKYIGRSCTLFLPSNPLKIVKAKGQYMYDENGDEYLDCVNNVSHVGHCHPAVLKAGCDQMQSLNTNSRYLHDNLVLLAEKITGTMPDKLSVCFLVNSGSEANDLALRLSQIHTGNEDVIALEHAYHGHLTSLIDISHYKFNLPGGPPQKDHVHVASYPDTYRGKYRDCDYSEEQLSKLYSDDVKKICEDIKSKKNRGTCAYIHESMMSCGGQIIPPKNYFKEVYEHVRANGGVCIADEVQTGFGRVGSHWWAFQMYDVVPDIVTMGKPMGNGHPVAAVVTTEEIAESFKNTNVAYFNTYGGNPVSCAIANAVFDTIEKENLRENALIVGEYLLDSCQLLAKKHRCIGNVRGVGLFVGIELVTDRVKRIPDPETAQYLVERMKEEHVIICSDGPDVNVIKFKPPIVFTKENVDTLVNTMDRVLKELRSQKESLSGPGSIQKSVEAPSKEPRTRQTIQEEQIKSI